MSVVGWICKNGDELLPLGYLPMSNIDTAPKTSSFGSGVWARFAGPIAADDKSLFGFVLVAIQFALVVLLLQRFSLETPVFRQVMQFAFVGFLIHHFLPAQSRMTFFLLLSLATITYVMGLGNNRWDMGLSLSRSIPLFVIGLALIGVCHLPLRFATRAALLVLAGCVLAWLRGNWTKWFGGGVDAAWIWPVLGSMFMFRLMIYLYEIQHEKRPIQPVKALSYFFLLPNVCFTLFPVIDYKTFSRSYYNAASLQIYQRGTAWMLRGIIQLLLWRVIYHEFHISPSSVNTGTDLARYVLSNMGLYLRISGQFHLIIGLLLMFGFNLPETNKGYFLAAGFNDYWRRVNIYWKDFIMKLFFLPVALRLKSWGQTSSVVAATIVAFTATWFLHSYQTFWVRSDFPIRSQDVLFWGGLGVLVVFSSLRELRHRRTRSLGTRGWSWKDETIRGIRTSCTFLVLSILWSLWSSGSLEQWVGIWGLADLTTLYYGAATMAVVSCAAVASRIPMWKASGAATRLGPATRVAPRGTMLRQAVLGCLLPSVLLLAVSVQRFHFHLQPGVQGLLGSLFQTKQSATDEEDMVRGYYDDLIDAGGANQMLGAAITARPADWQGVESSAAKRPVDDYRMRELTPSTQIVLNGKMLTTNRWGMRDKDYSLRKPDSTYRIAVLGSSYTMGLNVSDGEPYEAVVEERLNRERAGRPYERYELLNFAVNGYNPLQQVLVLRKRVLEFEPDAVILVAHPEEVYFLAKDYLNMLRQGVDGVPEILRRVAGEAGVDTATSDEAARRRLTPYWTRVWEWAFSEIAKECEQHGIVPLMVYLPSTGRGVSHASSAEMLRMGQAAGFTTFSLEGAYGNVDKSDVSVAPWDGHPNAEGHRLLANKLFAGLTEDLTVLVKPGDPR